MYISCLFPRVFIENSLCTIFFQAGVHEGYQFNVDMFSVSGRFAVILLNSDYTCCLLGLNRLGWLLTSYSVAMSRSSVSATLSWCRPIERYGFDGYFFGCHADDTQIGSRDFLTLASVRACACVCVLACLCVCVDHCVMELSDTGEIRISFACLERSE